ncbi:MAG: trypsin-like serine protease [bacterium]
MNRLTWLKWPVLAMLLLTLARQGDAQTLRRVLTPAEASAWRAVGSLNVLGAEACTAILISPHEAITAAHCAVDSNTGKLRPVGLYQLILGQTSDNQSRRYRIAASAVLPGYLADDKTNALAGIASDLALMTLATPVDPKDATPMVVAGWDKPIGDFVDILGYERGGPVDVTIREGCMVLDSLSGVSVANCSVISGLSGGPVVLSAPPGAAPTLVAVVSSTGQGHAYVVTVAPHLAELRALLTK